MERCRLHVRRYASGHWRCSVDCIPVTPCRWYHYRYLSSGTGRNDRSQGSKYGKEDECAILGIVENMSYLECPDCGKHINVFGESHTEQVAEEYGLKLLAQIPIDPKIAQMVDGGQVEYIEMPWFEEAVKAVENL